MTKPINDPSCFCTPFHTVHTKGEGQAVAPLSPRLWETPTPAHAAEQGPVPHNGAYTNTRRRTKTCLCFGRFSHPSPAAEEIHQWALWGWGGACPDLTIGSCGDIFSHFLFSHEVVRLQLDKRSPCPVNTDVLTPLSSNSQLFVVWSSQ